jgi:hypothetical protein
MKKYNLALTAAALVLFVRGAAADTLAYTFTSAPTSADTGYNLGFVFSIPDGTSITVDSLGWFDASDSGFTSSHEVGIFEDTDDALLTSATVDAGTVDPLVDGFRFVSIAPLVLGPGLYTIDGLVGSDPWDYGVAPSTIAGFNVDPSIGIAADAAVFAFTPSLVFPSSTFGGYTVYAGPNFTEGVATPEPVSIALIFCGMLLIAAAGVRRRQFHRQLPDRASRGHVQKVGHVPAEFTSLD